MSYRDIPEDRVDTRAASNWGRETPAAGRSPQVTTCYNT
jgi:hypothetical protein